MRRNLFSTTLLLAMAMLGQEEPKPIIPVGEDHEPWWLEFVAAMEAIGCRFHGKNGDGDFTVDVPRARMKEANELVGKYLTDETREAYARARGIA